MTEDFKQLKDVLQKGFVIQGSLKLTEQSFVQLRKQNIPQEILTMLEQLKNQEYLFEFTTPVSTAEDKFIKTLEKTIGKDQTAQYKSVIFQYAISMLVTNPKLLDLSEEVAKILPKTQQKPDGPRRGDKDKDTVNQFRKFFNEVRRLKNLINNTARLNVELRMLKARMGYASGRNTISANFSTVINLCIDRMIVLGDFNKHFPGFCDFFESLYAYYYYQNKPR